MHSQTAPPSNTVHKVLDPQGEGLHGSGLGGGFLSTTHLSKGLPTYPGGQLQIGLWFSTAHWELIPQAPGQGSWHWALIQAKLTGQSSCLTHSGLHPAGDKGSPSIPGKHSQKAWPTLTVHLVFRPQGEGLQGSFSICGGKQPVKGLPTNPGRHWHCSPKVVTKQSAFNPHGPGTQSWITSGSQPVPGIGPGLNPGKQVHWGLPPYPSKHSVLGPQASGWHPEASTEKRVKGKSESCNSILFFRMIASLTASD